jgi:hypothetical protein
MSPKDLTYECYVNLALLQDIADDNNRIVNRSAARSKASVELCVRRSELRPLIDFPSIIKIDGTLKIADDVLFTTSLAGIFFISINGELLFAPAC